MKLRKVTFLLFIIATICLITSCNKECKHQSTDWIIDKQATCTENGSKHKECTKCHEKLDTEVIEALGHNLVHHEKEDPTCTNKGHKAYDTCTRCDYTTYEEIPELGHIYEDGICTRCGYELTSSDLLYELTSDNTGYIVTGLDYSKYDINALTIIIPSEYKGLPVVGIKEESFKNRIKIKKIVLSNNITHIGNVAFKGCQGLMNIEIPNSVISIGSSAFSSCTGLTSIEIPTSVTNIGSSAFSDCTSITSITLPFIGNGNDITHFGYIFGASDYQHNRNYVPTSLKEVIITNAKSIRNCAFYKCAGITSIEIPNSVTSIEMYAFEGCTSLINIEIPNSVTSIGNEAFYGCTSLTSIEIPNSVTSIGEWAFSGCTNLTNVVIQDGLTSIGHSTFNRCTSLTSIEIPNSVTSIGEWAFSACTGLTNIEIPNSVTSIGNYAFNNCTGLTSIEIPDSVTSIGIYAFSGCTSIKSITVPFVGNGDKTRFECIFGYSVPASLKEVIITSATSIDNFAFEGCTGLTSIKIPNSVTSIGNYAFSGYTNLTIYCEASEKPSGWDNYWNSSNCKVVWGYKKN